MARKLNRKTKRIFRHLRIRKKLAGLPGRPRLCIHRSLNNFYAQIVDDINGHVMFGMSTLSKDVRGRIKSGGNLQAAEVLGEIFSSEAQKKGFKKVCFDRAGNLFHGRVKAFAEAARKAGMEF